MNNTGFDRTWSTNRLREFARACARRDKNARRTFVPDADLEAAFCGYAQCVAVVTNTNITLTARDLDLAVRSYRRIRRLTSRFDRSQRRLISVAQPTVAA